MNALLECSMEIGQMNFKVMSILDAGETTKYGHPTPTQVNVKATEGKCILISGHDLKDLCNLLEQTEGTGVNVYTHGEMLPAHGYPELRKFKHLIGNYGSGWQNQQVEFARFPGPIVMTSNCIIDPTVGAYDDRIWTRSIVGWPGVNHLEGEDFSPVIAQAQQMAGFPYSEIPHLITVGFGRQTLLGAADTLIDLVSREKLRHIFLVGGCDGARGERNYFTDFATSVPDDCLILTPPVVNTASTNWTLAISKGCRAWSTPGSVMTLTRRLFWRSRWRRNWAVASTICRCRWCSPGSNRKRSSSC